MARAACRDPADVRSPSGEAFIGFYNSDDLTFAASIAYYSLLSLFPFFLLAFSIVALVTSSDADRERCCGSSSATSRASSIS